MVRFQDSILEHLRHNTFFNMFFDETSKAHHAQILSFFGPRVGIWFIAQLVFLAFRLFSPDFSIVL
jgi:hypothetical protein